MRFVNKEPIVELETAKLLKECGFNWDVVHLYFEQRNPDSEEHEVEEIKFYYRGQYVRFMDVNNWNNINVFGLFTFSAPTQTVAMKWLRETLNIDICICRSFAFDKSYYFEVVEDGNFDEIHKSDTQPDVSYEQCVEEALQFALERYLKKKKENET